MFKTKTVIQLVTIAGLIFTIYTLTKEEPETQCQVLDREYEKFKRDKALLMDSEIMSRELFMVINNISLTFSLEKLRCLKEELDSE